MTEHDVPTALAKIADTAITLGEALKTPSGLGKLLVAMFITDRTVSGGYLSDTAQQLLRALLSGLESLGVQVGHSPEYVWYLVSRYGQMFATATTPSKAELIYHAFFSEFNETWSTDADIALFRDILDRLDYNEALVLAGLHALYSQGGPGGVRQVGAATIVQPSHPNYHTIRSIMRKGDLCIVTITDDPSHSRVVVIPTLALARFVAFVDLKCKPLAAR